jgi:hypothetical protein
VQRWGYRLVPLAFITIGSLILILILILILAYA